MKPLIIIAAGLLVCAAPLRGNEGIVPTGKEGQPLNLGFEDGTLKDWKAEGRAFDKQPVRGDTVNRRRNDMRSQHAGEYWVGTFEIHGDDATGTLTSVPFQVTHRYASFLIGGGSTDGNRVELVSAADGRAFFKVYGFDTEAMRRVVVDLEPHQGKEIFIRVVDVQIGGWGHTNFDDFRFHADRPVFANAVTEEELKKQAAVLSPDVVKFAGLSGEEAAREMTLPPGFKATLFAAEPDVQQPIAFCIDERGRLWVAEGYAYPRRAPEGQGKDRILIFEDTNGDGKFDVRKVFKDDLNLVSGLEVGFGGVWVGAAPYFMFIPDRNRDDVPDGAPEILLDGWDYIRDTHETLNTFAWGPDGWLYGCHGVFCPSHVGKPGSPEAERQRIDAGIWRYHPIRHEFEVFAEGTSNPWGIDFDEYGQCFIEACVVPHLWHMIQGGRYQRQGGQHFSINLEEQQRAQAYLVSNTPRFVNPFVYDDLKTIADHVHWAGTKGPHAGNDRSDAAGGGHAHAGLMIYLGGSWPEEYRGKIFMNNIHGQRINMDIPKRKGSGYTASHGPDFVLFNDKWSQVLNLLYDQDGSVYMIDWYDKNQCHRNEINVHDRSNGRIFKITYGNTPFTRVDLRARTDAELVAAQLHQNDWYVRHARRLLQERAAAGSLGAEATTQLLQILRTHNDVTRRLRALWALHAIGTLSEPVLLECLSHPSEYIRSWAIQLLCERKNPSSQALSRFTELAQNDPSPMVRLYLAAAMQRTHLQSRVPVLERLIAHEADATDHNLPLMYWYALEPVVGADRNAAVSLISKARIPELRKFITRRMTATSREVAGK